MRCRFLALIVTLLFCHGQVEAQEEFSVLTAVRTLDGANDRLRDDAQSFAREHPGDDGQDGDDEHREVLTERYPDGRIRLEKQVSRDFAGRLALDGYWRMFDEKGHRIIEGQMRDGKKTGPWMRVVDRAAQEKLAGDLAGFEPPFVSEVEFDDGRMHGQWTLRDRQKRLVFDIGIKNGARDGAVAWRHPNGNLMREAHYQEGVLDGPYREWSDAGKLTLDDQFVDGRRQIKQVDYHDQQAKKAERLLLSQRLQIKNEDDWWNTKLAEYQWEGQEVAHGEWTAWHANGHEKMRVTYRWGDRQGAATWWYENGQLKTQGQFENDLEHGDWVWWHENGSTKTKGRFERGRPIETWRAWREDGRLQGKMVDPYQKLGRREYSVLQFVRGRRDCLAMPMLAHYADPVAIDSTSLIDDARAASGRWGDRAAFDPNDAEVQFR